MAIYSASVKSISRSGGRSATAAAAYRTGEEIHDERTGQTFDYRRRGGVESVSMRLPEGVAAMTTAELWNLAEGAEKRKDSKVARELLVALPHELDTAQRQALADAIASDLVERYQVGAQVAVHLPDAEGDNRNHHAHILFTTRRLGPDGLGEKTRELDVKPSSSVEVEWIRAMVEGRTNAALEAAGHAERVDRRSLADQHAAALEAGDQVKAMETDRAPTIHDGPAITEARREAERRGEPAPDLDKLARSDLRRDQRELAQVSAKIYEWEVLAERRAKAEQIRRMVPDAPSAPAQIHDLAAARAQRGLPAVEQPAPAKRENEAQRVERLLAEAAAAKRQWDDLVHERQAIQTRQAKGQPAYVTDVIELGHKRLEAQAKLESAKADQARQEQRMAAHPNPLTDWATRLGHKTKVDLARREAKRADQAFRGHPDYKRAVAWNTRNKADQARLARPAGRDAPQIDLEISEARARAEAAQRAADRAAADPRELVRQMDAALLDRKNALAELPRNAQAERELAADREVVRALRQQIEQPDRPSAEALSEILERHQVQARHWQGVAEGVTRERTRRLLQERQRAQQALREAVEREQGIEAAQAHELARIEREERRIEQLLADVDSFDQGKPKPLPALAEERQRLEQDRQRLDEVPAWAEQARAEALEQEEHHRPSPFRPW
ncbi:MobQ family relaxase (plasmid) [Acinetobacter baumannii]|nr:MobA/MobL family protein [Pseudomonas aeruginosa]